MRITYRVLVPCKVTINCERTLDPPWGIAGGACGAPNRAVIKPANGPERIVLKGTEIPLEAGDRVTFETAGGGGYGDAGDAGSGTQSQTTDCRGLRRSRAKRLRVERSAASSARARPDSEEPDRVGSRRELALALLYPTYRQSFRPTPNVAPDLNSL